jgi:hypothetical protein
MIARMSPAIAMAETADEERPRICALDPAERYRPQLRPFPAAEFRVDSAHHVDYAHAMTTRTAPARISLAPSSASM